MEQLSAGRLIARIASDDESLVMPPVDSGKKLKPEQIEMLRRWIAEGAEYKPHWAFVPPTRPALPAVSDPAWVKNPIDAFVLAKLDQEQLKPSPAASPQTLLREAWMRRTIRKAQREGFAHIAVVCGAWHAPALLGSHQAGDDAALVEVGAVEQPAADPRERLRRRRAVPRLVRTPVERRAAARRPLAHQGGARTARTRRRRPPAGRPRRRR